MRSGTEAQHRKVNSERTRQFRESGLLQKRRKKEMLEYMFSHSFFGLCAWDLPALIVLIAMVVVFAVHRHNMKKRENEFEDELAERMEGGAVEGSRV